MACLLFTYYSALVLLLEALYAAARSPRLHRPPAQVGIRFRWKAKNTDTISPVAVRLVQVRRGRFLQHEIASFGACEGGCDAQTKSKQKEKKKKRRMITQPHGALISEKGTSERHSRIRWRCKFDVGGSEGHKCFHGRSQRNMLLPSWVERPCRNRQLTQVVSQPPFCQSRWLVQRSNMATRVASPYALARQGGCPATLRACLPRPSWSRVSFGFLEVVDTQGADRLASGRRALSHGVWQCEASSWWCYPKL